MIPDEVYLDAELDHAFHLLYDNGVTPDKYREMFDSQFRKEYTYGEIASQHGPKEPNDEHIDNS